MVYQSVLKKACCLFLVLFLACSAGWQAARAESQALVRLGSEPFEVGAGQVEALNILIENAADVYGLDIRGKFDPAVVEVVDADPARDGINLVPGALVQPDFLVRNFADNTTGVFQYVITQVNPTPPANGTGILLTLLVRGKVEGKQTGLEFTAVTFANRKGITLDVTFRNGVIKVVAPRSPTATPVPTAAPTQPPDVRPQVVGNPGGANPAGQPPVNQADPGQIQPQGGSRPAQGMLSEIRAGLMKALYSLFPPDAAGGSAISLSSVGLWGIGGAFVLVVGALLFLLVPSKKRKKNSSVRGTHEAAL